MKALQHKLILLNSWKKLLLAFLSGVIAAFSMPPYGAFPVLLISFPLLLLLLESANGVGERRKMLRHSFALGWSFGFGYFLNGLWWIGAAFLVDADKFAVFLPFAVLAMPLGLGLFHGFAALLTRLLWGEGVIKVLSFTASFFLLEYLRGHILTGFPWNLFGYALTQNLWLAQSASIVGVYGLTLLTLFIFASMIMWFEGKRLVPLLSLTTLIIMAGFGAWRLQTPVTFVDGVKLRILQANIPQDAKFNRANKKMILDKYLTLSDSATSSTRTGLKDVTHLVWSESAFPFFLSQDKEALSLIARSLPANTTLITGAVRMGELLSGQTRPQVFNSVYVLNSTGEFLHSYDKVKLVPFGEFLPFQNTLEAIGLRQLTQVIGGFSSGQRRETFTLKDAPPVTPLVCYEVIFPSEVTNLRAKAGWLVNVTNDAWFGMTPGPHQHWHFAKVRAIEEGLPLVRSANNGISGVVDGMGREINILNLGETGVVDSRLPKSLKTPVNPPFGGVIQLLGFLSVILLIFTLKRRNSTRYNFTWN